MSSPGHSFVARYDRPYLELATPVKIAISESLGGSPEPPREYRAIWDTGATGTMVSPKVAAECSLLPVSQAQVTGVDGKRRHSDVYQIDIFLPNGVRVTDAQVCSAPLTDNTDVLIGMDIIVLGDFAVSTHQGKTTFTFRVPSVEEIDFTATAPVRTTRVGRNASCPCGSNKKYKKCCGA